MHLDRLKRREIIKLLGGAAAAWPLVARAQQGARLRRLGVLIPYTESDAEAKTEIAAFRQTLEQLGWRDGRNLVIEYRWASGDAGRIRAYAKELVALAPDVIFCRTTPVTAALGQETRTIPIVFVNVSDPVGAGFVASIARPGGNITGFTNVEQSLGSKWVELLKELDPRISRVGVLFGPTTSPGRGMFYCRLIEDAARSIAVETIAAPVAGAADIETAVAAFAQASGAGLIVQPDVTTTDHRTLILRLAAQHRLPAVYPFRFFVAEGGLASYGINVVDLYRRAASYVDRILKGEKPGDLPVQAPVKFELAINLKTDKALGLTVPDKVLALADEVIE
jgi:putative tryptophan/tyrosine transport system substrate-binding protein